ncbi:MAG: FUN14 domain-containing protein, partial [Nitrososphaeraceae archaeon]
VGFGGIVGFLVGFVIRKLFKTLAIIAGVFFAVLMYLEQQGIVNVNWDKLQGVLSTIVNTVTNSTASGGIGVSPATTSLLPAITNLGIPLTSSMATGFAIGIMKG